jgi:high affinity Mn2+ porin
MSMAMFSTVATIQNAGLLGFTPAGFRGGLFDLSSVPNAKTVERNFGEFEMVGEVEKRYKLDGHSGKVKVLGFVNHGRMARYDDAVRLAQESGGTPDVASVRRFASRPGFAVNVEQEVAPGIGAFARASANDGSKEAYEFTEINRSIAGGLSIKAHAGAGPTTRLLLPLRSMDSLIRPSATLL